MKHTKTRGAKILHVLSVILAAAGWLSAGSVLTIQAQEADKIREVNLGGYLSVAHSQAPASFNVGFSFYTAAWPLVEKYQGHRFQSGLYGTWMHPQHDGPAPANLYCDIEGGLGWWTDTRFPTETPKFIMGGVGPNVSEIANGPAHGAGDWNEPRGLYGVAQLSPWLLFPIDGLNVRQGACGQLFGYGYLALPLTPAKAATDGADVPTGDHCWTLFLSTKNFKGPVAFFTPYFWSHATVKKPEWTPVSPKAVPADTKLARLNFDRPSEPVAQPYTTPEGPNTCWKKPGPVAGPFQKRLGDGSAVTYYWYRFADQPALLNAGLTKDEREQLQKRVEKIHRSWPKNRDYLAPPTVGTLCDLDPALLVTPPKGKEVGYVPIVTRQESGGLATHPRGH